MTNVLVDDSYLSDIADTIRSKLGVQDTYKPSEMADAIDDIGGGVTPTGTKQISVTANGTTTEDVTNYASAEITVAVPSATLGTKSITENGTYNASSDSLDGYSSVTVNVSGGGGVDYLAQRCNNTLTTYHSEEVTTIQGQVFNSASALESVVLPNLSNIPGFSTFTSCTHLLVADIGGTFTVLQNNTFNGCSRLATLIIRNTTACNLGNINAFTNTPFASGGTGGTLYVPQALISTYEGKSNWSTILGYANNSIQKIEGSIYETAYADGTPIA